MDWNNPYIHSVVLIVAISVAFLTIMLMCAVTVLAERRVLAFIQGRLGPNRVGFGGMLQPFADFLKTMMKEDLVPDQATRFVFMLAPVIAIMTAIMAIVIYPFGPTITLPRHIPTRHCQARRWAAVRFRRDICWGLRNCPRGLGLK
jgi:NADH-quinone oxidoreductase subunit H